MRSLKSYGFLFQGVRMLPGKLYVLEFPNRSFSKEYLFEFAGANDKHIMHRGKWVVDFDWDNVQSCDTIECLVTFRDSEPMIIKKYRGEVNW